MKDKILGLYKKHKDVVPYLVFGVLTTAVNVVSYALLSRVFKLGTVPCVIIAWFLAVLFAYLTNRRWVFKSRARTRKEITREVVSFFGCRLATGVLDWLIMIVFVDGLHMNDILIKIIANIVVIVLNYVASKLVIFKASRRSITLNERIGTAMKWAVYGLLTFMIGVIMILNLFVCGSEYNRKVEFLLPNIVLLLIAGALIGGLAFLAKKNKLKIFKKKGYKGINILSAVLFIGLIYVTLNTCFHPGWDVGTVFDSAQRVSYEMFEPGESAFQSSYFSSWPNQQFLLLLEAFLLKVNRIFGIVSGDQGIMVLVGLQVLLLVITGNLLFRIIYRKTKSKAFSYLGWGMFVVLLALSGWINVPYTDMLAVCFPVIIYFVYLKKDDSEKHRWLWWALIGLLTYWGYKTKPSAAIMTIAILGGEMIFGIMKKETIRLKEMAKGGAALVLSMLISMLAFPALFSLTKIEVTKDFDVGPLHLVMMGLNKDTNGVYALRDVIFTDSFGTDKAARTAGQKEEIKRRLNEFGVSGLLEHSKKKALTVFNDGTFAWATEGTYGSVMYDIRNVKMGPFLRDVFYETGNKYPVLAAVQQAVWLVVLLLCGLCLFLKKDRHMTVLVISLIGIILFNMLFEARARYLIVFVPIFVLTATLVLERIASKICKK